MSKTPNGESLGAPPHGYSKPKLVAGPENIYNRGGLMAVDFSKTSRSSMHPSNICQKICLQRVFGHVLPASEECEGSPQGQVEVAWRNAANCESGGPATDLSRETAHANNAKSRLHPMFPSASTKTPPDPNTATHTTRNCTAGNVRQV